MVALNNIMDSDVASYRSKLRGSFTKNNERSAVSLCTTPVRQPALSPSSTPFRTPGLIGEIRHRRRSAPAAASHSAEDAVTVDTIPPSDNNVGLLSPATPVEPAVVASQVGLLSPSTPVPAVVATQDIQVAPASPLLDDPAAGISDSQMMSAMVDHDDVPANEVSESSLRDPTTCEHNPTPDADTMPAAVTLPTDTVSEPLATKSPKKRCRKEKKSKTAKKKRHKKETKNLLHELLQNQATICQQLMDLDLKFEAQCSALMRVDVGGVMENIFEKIKEIKTVASNGLTPSPALSTGGVENKM